MYATLSRSIFGFFWFSVESFLQGVKDPAQEDLLEDVLQWQQWVGDAKDLEIHKEDDDDEVDARSRSRNEISFLVQHENS